MAEKTTNYGLTKPLSKEFYDVQVQNDNMDIIDEELKKKYDPNNKPKPNEVGAVQKVATYISSGVSFDLDKATDSLYLIPIGVSKNCPITDTFLYIRQLFYGSANETANRLQIAYPYSPTALSSGIAIRNCKDNVWGQWVKLATGDSADALLNPVLLTSADDVNQITTNGFYYWRTNNKPANVPTENGAENLTAMRVWTEDGVTCFQEVADMYSGTTHNCVMRRTVDGGEGYPWEWVNPPMEIGVEYRTVERYDGEPVFVTLQSDGTVNKRTDYHGDITGTLPVSKGGTGASTAKQALQNLGAAPAYSYGTSDLTAGVSELETGKLYFVYE